MIFVTGGAWQGKLDFAKKLSEELGIEVKVAEGRTDDYLLAGNSSIIHDFHEYIKRLLKDGKSIDDFLDDIKRDNPEVIIISNELGCGIVPLDPFDREWREASGRVSVRLAKEAMNVYRLVCGIASQIK